MKIIENRHHTFVPVLMLFVMAALLLFAVASTASARNLSTDAVKPADIQSGTYTLIAHGCNSAEDLSPVAILQKEGTPYSFSIVEPRGQYEQVPGLSAGEAMRRAEEFAQCSPSAGKTAVTEIRDSNNTVIGYEVKPTFLPLRSGSSDGVDTSYRVKGDKVLAYIEPDPLLQGNAMGGG